jgi:hypothetical protein
MPDIAKDYWQARNQFKYYQEALRLCRAYSAGASSVLEVGPHNTTFLDWLDWIPRKVAIDQAFKPVIHGAENIRGDFMSWETGEIFDLTVCLQVLEHIEDATAFAQKLLACSRALIVSVPYKWRAGGCQWHCQDPVDLEKLVSWFGRYPSEHVVVRDEAERLIAVFAAERST